MEFNADTLLKYQEIKDCIEERAEVVLKEYFKFKNWNFPKDFSLGEVEILDNNEVRIEYYGFQDKDREYVPMDYFLTLDNKFLSNY